MIFYLQNGTEYMLEKQIKKVSGNHFTTLSGLAGEGRILLPVLKDKEAVKVEKETSTNRSNLIAAARNGDGRSYGKSDYGRYGYIFHDYLTELFMRIF